MSSLLRLLMVLALCPIAACTADRTGGGGGAPSGERDVAQACARLSGCTSLSAGGCKLVLSQLGLADSTAAFVLAASDCGAATSCVNAGAPGTTCTPDTAACDGDVIRHCANGATVARDCAAEGLSCVQDTVGRVFCGRAGSCTASTCDGNTLLSCVNGSIEVRDCGADTCAPDPDLGGAGNCIPAGTPCTGFVFRCDGDVAVSCRSGVLVREPCGPGLCTTGDGVFCMPNPACSPARCDGSFLVTCVAGVPERTDCAQWGFDTCIAGGEFGPTCASSGGGGA